MGSSSDQDNDPQTAMEVEEREEIKAAPECFQGQPKPAKAGVKRNRIVTRGITAATGFCGEGFGR